MATLLSVNKIAEGRANSDERGVREFEEVWQVLFETRATLIEAANATGLPLRYAEYPGYEAALAVGAHCSFADPSGLKFIFVVRYTTAYRPEDQQDINPLFRRTVWSGGTDKHQLPYGIDVEGKKVLNAAGDPFEVLPVRDASRVLLVARRNLAFNPEDFAAQWVNKLNSSGYRGKSPRTLKVERVSWGDPQIENDVEYIPTQWEFAHSIYGWDQGANDVGFFAKLADGRRIRVAGDNPRFLQNDGAGNVRFTDEQQITSFKPYETINFYALPIEP